MDMERQAQEAHTGKRIELLAPAGNREAFYGAVHAGADAVYLGGEKFGARAYADNFSREDLTDCIRYGHIHGCKSYLTVNTLIKEPELPEMVEELGPLYEAGLDGVIVQDIGALQVIRLHFPKLEIHASTQMTVTGPEGAKLLKELGVSRVVPARELSLRELESLKRESGLEVEAFIHGAMCYCYSGACLFSSFLGGRSGNRGRCAQPCRLAYETDSPGASVHKKEYYPLSLKDLCAIEHLPELIEGGIDSLKIEGRMKKPEYAAGVTAIYRKYIDRYLAHRDQTFHVEKEDLEALSGLYIRSQRQDGYFFRQNGREMVTLESPSYSGCDETALRKVRQNYLDQKKRLCVRMKAEFVCGKPACLQIGTGKWQTKVCGSMVEPARNRPILEEDIRKQLQKLGESCFALESLEIRTDEKGFYPLKDINTLRREAVRRLEDQVIAGHGLTVRRETPLPDCEAVGAVQAETPLPPRATAGRTETLAGPAGDLSAAALEAENARDGAMAARNPLVRGMRVHISTEEQLLYLAEHMTAMRRHGPNQGRNHRRLTIERLYVESCLLPDVRIRKNRAEKRQGDSGRGKEGEKTEQAMECLRKEGLALWVALPYILRDKDHKWMENCMELYRQGKIQGFLVRNLEEYGWLRQEAVSGADYSQGLPYADGQGGTPWIWLDHTVYVWNSYSAAFWQSRGCGLTCPLELTGREWERMQCSDNNALNAGNGDMPEKLVYGRVPMMVTANCIARTAGKCLHIQSGRTKGELTDRYRAKFPVEIRCDVCMNIIYNSIPLSLHRECIPGMNKRLSFTTESGGEMWEILQFFADAEGAATGNPPYKNYTTGHEKKGVL